MLSKQEALEIGCVRQDEKRRQRLASWGKVVDEWLVASPTGASLTFGHRNEKLEYLRYTLPELFDLAGADVAAGIMEQGLANSLACKTIDYLARNRWAYDAELQAQFEVFLDGYRAKGWAVDVQWPTMSEEQPGRVTFK